MKSVFITMSVVIFFVAAMIFSASNTEVVSINYFVAQGNFNISHVIGVAFLLGFVICWLIFLSFYITMKLKLRMANNKLVKLDTKPVVSPVIESSPATNV